jgi:hypothetical protein
VKLQLQIISQFRRRKTTPSRQSRIQQCTQTMGMNKTMTATADRSITAKNMDTFNGNDAKTKSGEKRANNLRP